jgi:Leucine-rich repeat (LRR) protein
MALEESGICSNEAADSSDEDCSVQNSSSSTASNQNQDGDTCSERQQENQEQVSRQGNAKATLSERIQIEETMKDESANSSTLHGAVMASLAVAAASDDADHIAVGPPSLDRFPNHQPVQPGALSVRNGVITRRESSRRITSGSDSTANSDEEDRFGDPSVAAATHDVSEHTPPIVASLVVAADLSSSFVRGVPLVQEDSFKQESIGQKKRYHIAAALLILLFVVVTVLLSVVLTQRQDAYDLNQDDGRLSDSPRPSSSPSSSPTLNIVRSPFEQRLLDLVLNATQGWDQDGANVLNTSTMQNVAFTWLLEDQRKFHHNSTDQILQRYALAVSAYSINMPDPILPSTENECDIPFVTCENSNNPNVITSIDTWGCGEIAGTLPPDIGLFSGMEQLRLWDSQYGGTIPTTLGLMSSLQGIYMNNNKFSGTLPSQVAGLTNLRRLDLERNFLTGEPPVELFQLSRLEDLNIANNAFTGTIPDELYLSSSIKFVNLDDNNFSGTLSTMIGTMAQLLEIRFSFNSLFSTIPDEIANLTSLQGFSASHSQLWGTVPTGIFKTSTTYLNLSWNNFTGRIPTEIGLLSNVKYLHCDENSLTGPIPTEIGHLTALSKELHLSSNLLSGTLPTELGRLTSMSAFWVNRNRLSGTVPSEISRLVALTNLKMGDNALLSGTVPSELGLLTSLEELTAFGSSLTGEVPDSVCALRSSGRLFSLELPCEVTCSCCTVKACNR